MEYFKTFESYIQKPLIVFHGSRNIFDSFELQDYDNGGYYGQGGFHFTDNLEYAKSFGDNIYMCVISYLKPIQLNSNIRDHQIFNKFLPFITDENDLNYIEECVESGNLVTAFRKILKYVSIDKMKELKFDSIITTADYPSGGKEYIVFNDYQIEIIKRFKIDNSIKTKVTDQKGKPLVVFHGGKKSISTFNVPTNPEYRVGLYTSSKIEVAQCYGTEIYPLHLIMNKPFQIDAKGEGYYDIPTPKIMKPDVHKSMKTVDTDGIAIWAMENGYDGVIIKNVLEGNGVSKISDVYITFDAKNIIKL